MTQAQGDAGLWKISLAVVWGQPTPGLPAELWALEGHLAASRGHLSRPGQRRLGEGNGVYAGSTVGRISTESSLWPRFLPRRVLKCVLVCLRCWC